MTSANASGATATSAADGRTDNGHSEFDFWRDHSRVNLSPIAAPSILGLYGFAVATFMVAAHLANWYGTPATPLILFPFAFAFGGIAQFLAAMWSYRARDAIATAMHGAWGSFWIAFGIYHLLIAIGMLPSPTASPVAATAYGFWFIGLAAVTWAGAFAALAENIALSLVLGTLAAGATLLAIALTMGLNTVEVIGALVLIASAVLAWYTATAMMLQAAFKRVILPLGKRGAEPDAPGKAPKGAIQYQVGEPGIKIGQ